MTLAAALTLLAGFLIGATTLGGLIVVPALTEFARFDVDRAVASSSAALLAPALLATRAAWQDMAQRRAVAVVVAGSAVGAAVGAFLLAMLPTSFTVGLIAALALIGGIRGLASDRWHARGERERSISAILVLSIAAGLLSAITGTGGPVALWPLLSLAAQPIALCWLAAHAIQLPVALAATAVNGLAGRLEPMTTLMLAGLLAAGFLVGQRLAARRNVLALARAASVMLLAIAVWLAWILVR
ncbi:MAG TPA: TSUP family transporter [Casimicrobiaceae bacterium]|nr:TSUP family transporter [Casimicrobiaceae bacterium]